MKRPDVQRLSGIVLRASSSIENQFEFCRYELKGGECREYKDEGYYRYQRGSGMNFDLIKEESQLVLLEENEKCCIYQIKNESGEGVMIMYQVFNLLVIGKLL